MTSRCKLPSCPKLKAKLFASSSNNLCNDDRVVGSRSTRSLAANLDRLRRPTNWATSLMANTRPVPSRLVCHVTSLSATGTSAIGCYRGWPLPSPANSALPLIHLFVCSSTVHIGGYIIGYSCYSGYVITPSPTVFTRLTAFAVDTVHLKAHPCGSGICAVGRLCPPTRVIE
jgi:hypothetical protein